MSYLLDRVQDLESHLQTDQLRQKQVTRDTNSIEYYRLRAFVKTVCDDMRVPQSFVLTGIEDGTIKSVRDIANHVLKMSVKHSREADKTIDDIVDTFHS